MKKIRIVICDKNIEDAQFYEKLCREFGDKYSIYIEIKIYTTADSFLFDLENIEFRKRVDVIFFTLTDSYIESPELLRKTGYNGIAVFVGEPEVIVSCEKLFDARAYNFIQKSSDSKHLERFLRVFQNATNTAEKTRTERLVLSYGGEIRQIHISDIHYFEVSEHFLTVCYGEDEKFTFISSLAKMENHLKGRNFIRVSRFYLISIDAIKQITSKSVLMCNDKEIPVGRKYYTKLKSFMEQDDTV